MVEFKLSDWFSAYQDRRFDLIVSNPPYIAVGDEHLHQTSLPYEPESALVSGPQGLADLDRIIRTARAHLTERGVLILEHGYEQGQACRSLLEQAGFSRCYTKRDLGGQERISVGML